MKIQTNQAWDLNCFTGRDNLIHQRVYTNGGVMLQAVITAKRSYKNK